MIKGYLNRLHEDDQGTLGVLSFPSLQWSCMTMELPWRNNKVRFSRIPSGVYVSEIYDSPHFGRVYILHGVDGRSYILTHYGNWAGDVTKGFITDSEGCVLLGFKPAYIRGQKAVTNSRSTFDAFMRKLSGQKFKLAIQ